MVFKRRSCFDPVCEPQRIRYYAQRLPNVQTDGLLQADDSGCDIPFERNGRHAVPRSSSFAQQKGFDSSPEFFQIIPLVHSRGSVADSQAAFFAFHEVLQSARDQLD